MTPSTPRTGRRGEDVVARYLARRGWHIAARNWRGGGGEIDLVARRGRVLALCEVKTRRRDDGTAERVTLRQRERIRRAARSYLASHPWPADGRIRLDLVLVSARGRLRGWTVDHLPGALEEG